MPSRPSSVFELSNRKPWKLSRRKQVSNYRKLRTGEGQQAICTFPSMVQQESIPRTTASLTGNRGTSKTHPRTDIPCCCSITPLNIYRHQVIKQADVLLAMFLLSHEFSLEAKKRNFEFYDPLTTGDSSLSSCMEAIVALEIGDFDKAVNYARAALLMDLADVGGNVKDGCHIASMGGTWMVLTYGF